MDDSSGTRASRPPRSIGHDSHQPDMHALRTPLTVAVLRTQVLRRHLRRGDDLPSLEAELDQIDATLAELALAIDQLNRDGRYG